MKSYLINENQYFCSMAVTKIPTQQFVQLALTDLIIDVRSPSEYAHAHCPNSVSIPLFNDEERKIVGTTYKKQSREEAIKIGLDYYGPKMKEFVNQVEGLLNERSSKTVVVYCWRGGMRSAAVAWLLDLYGFQVYQLIGGYKSFRNWVLEQFQQSHNLLILSGHTGSGKTAILHELNTKNQFVIDLEALAGHKGSAFGNLKHTPQGSNEFFENKLALELFKIQQENSNNAVIWLESESSRIGDVSIHPSFFSQMKQSKRISISIPFEERLNYIVEEYGTENKQELIAAVERIRKKIGGLEAQKAIDFLQNDDVKSAFTILLDYYDRFYTKNTLYNSTNIQYVLPTTDALTNSQIILEKLHQNDTFRL